MKTTTTMKGFFTGILTGLAIGYLTAPRSGKETRDQLLEAANDQTKGLKEQWDKTVSQAKHTFDSVLSQVGMATDKVENIYDDLKDDATSAYQPQKIKSEYNSTVNDAAAVAKSDVNKAKDTLKID